MSPPNLMETFGALFASWRRRRALTLGQLSLYSGISKPTLSRWEKDVNIPRVPELSRVMDTLRLSATERVQAWRLLDAPRTIAVVRGGFDAASTVSLGDMLYGLRQRAGRTQEEVARDCGVSRSLYGLWEKNGTKPDAAQLHAAGFALRLAADEIAALSTRSFAHTALPDDRAALLEHYQKNYTFQDQTYAGRSLYLLSLLAQVGRLYRVNKADIGDVAMLISSLGDVATIMLGDAERATAYYRRSLQLAAQSNESLHFHLIHSFRIVTDPKEKPMGDEKDVVQTYRNWLPRFRDNKSKAFLLMGLARSLAPTQPEHALMLGEQYCTLVENDADEYPCRLRDFGNLLRLCGRPAESVAFISCLQPQDTFREGVKYAEMAQGLIALGSRTDAASCLTQAKQIQEREPVAYLHQVVTDTEKMLA